MFLMLAGKGIYQTSCARFRIAPSPGSLHFTSHVAWQGGSLHDLIQPGFSFLVGAALPFSILAPQAQRESTGKMLFHAAWRLVFVSLGIFLRSIGRTQTNFSLLKTPSRRSALGTFSFFSSVSRE